MVGVFRALVVVAGLSLSHVHAVEAQQFPTDDAVIRTIWREGMENSQLYRLAQALLDSIGPRLNNSPEHQAGNDWLVRTYQSWGIPARQEAYGTWLSWRRGVSHLDLVAPRVRSLEALILGWSPGTGGQRVEAEVIALPAFTRRAEFDAWLPQVRGRFVMISAPQPTCRPDDSWQRHALPAALQALRLQRSASRQAWDARVRATGHDSRTLPRRLEEAGAAGILTSYWSQGWGVNRIFRAYTERVPTYDVACEDYGLLYRLASHGQGPRVVARADAEFLGELPVHNTIAEVRGRELPGEYVMLSAHFDSWDGASGATDNGTGTVTMLEAMRILRAAYPEPRRTILVGHWGGEEQGLNGSRAFVADNPHIVDNIHVLFNQDNGTGRIGSISMEGFTRASESFARWFGRIPPELTGGIRIQAPGSPGGGGTDHASFVCAGVPAFNLTSLDFDYRNYTWHTNRDTFDKLSFDDLRMNATLVALLVYLAAEDPQRMPRQRTADVAQAGADDAVGAEGLSWPQCQPPARSTPAGR
jgi:carboxypeptidase Q